MEECDENPGMERKEEPNEPPHVWVALLGIALSYAITNGTMRSFGLIYVELLDLFQEGSVRTSLILTVSAIIATVLGLISGVLSDHVTARLVVVPSGVIASLGFLGAAFAPNLTIIIVAYSISTGCCDGVCYVYWFRMVNLYFSKWRGLANGIATAGGSFGSLFLPLLFRALIDKYSVRGLFFICAGLLLNISVGGALLRPAELKRRKEYEGKNLQMMIKNAYRKETTSYSLKLGTSKPTQEYELDIAGQEAISARRQNERITVSVVQIDDRVGNTSNDCKVNGVSGKGKTKRLLKTLFKVQFFLLVMQWLFGVVCVYGPLAYLPAYASDENISQTPIMLSVIGTVDLCARCIVGYIGDRNTFPKRLLMAAGFLISGTATILLPVFRSYTYFVVYSVIFGISCGNFLVLAGPLIVEILGTENVGTGMGIYTVCYGISNSFHPLIFGFIKETTRSYSLGFLLVGGANIFNALIAVVQQLVFVRDTRKVYNIEPKGLN